MELAQAEPASAARPRLGQRLLDERCLQPLLAAGQRAAVVEEGHRDQAAAEQPARDEYERQHAADLTVLLGAQVDGLVAVDLTRDLSPRGQVRDGGARMRFDEAVPGFVDVGGHEEVHHAA